MSSYTSLASYVLAVRLRSAKTVLVEGKTDKKILSRIILEHVEQSGGAPSYLIDDVSIVNDSSQLAGMGNKDKLLQVGEVVGGAGDKFKCLADREWDGWDLGSIPKQLNLPDLSFGYFTKGHSIENYWFLESALTAFLKNAHPEHLSIKFFEALKSRFEEMLRFSASFSLAMKDAQVIVKSADLLNCSHVIWNGESYLLREGFQTALKCRGVQCEVYELWGNRHQALKYADSETLQWLCHGHLGEEAIRSCTAHLAAEFNMSRAVVDQIERGSKAEKMSHDASHISKLSRQSIDPLDKLVDWVLETASSVSEA